MDLNLPGIDGIAVTKQIRICDARKKFVPIIAITAYSDREIQKACFSAGMNDFLTKPIQKQQVEAIIRKYSNTIIPCKFLIPWYKEGTGCKTCAVDNSNIFIPDTILTR
jgi:DNA-binding response OmpR family regulator